MRSAAPATAARGRSRSSGCASPPRQLREHLGAALAADLDEEAVPAVEDLGQREVVACLGLRTGAHRDAEAGAGGLEAVDGDDERVLAARRVVAVGVAAAEEDAVLDRDRVQLAGAHADERERRILERLLLDLEAAVAAPRPPEPDARRKQELLPRVRADRVAEARLVLAPLEPVGAGVLDVRPADRQRRRPIRARRRRSRRRARSARRRGTRGRQRDQEALERLGLDHARLDVRQALHSLTDPRNRTDSDTSVCDYGFPRARRIVRMRSARGRDDEGASPLPRPRRRPGRRLPAVRLRPRPRHGLGGFVLNDGDGVLIEAEGDAGRLDAFAAALGRSAPPLARVDSVTAEALPRRGERELRDRAERARPGGAALIPPDVATCDDCLRELFDPADRRYRYPFLNCTQCGPRFTIVRSVPYDRPNDDDGRLPDVRRLPARVRGPGRPPLPRRADRAARRAGRSCRCRSRRRSALLRTGAIVAVKGLGGYHLACDATDEDAVAPLRARKRAGGEAVRADDLRAGGALRGLRRGVGAARARRRGRSCSCAGAPAPRSPSRSRRDRRGSA